MVKRAITNHSALNEAYDYGSAFSRGMRIDLNGVTILLISGTASIDDEGRTVHVGDLRAQTRRTFDNISALLAPKARPGMTSCGRRAICAISSATTRPSTKSGPRSTRARTRSSAGFHRNPSDSLPSDLLVEIEAIAMFRRESSNEE